MLDDYAVFIRDVNIEPAFIGYFLTQRREDAKHAELLFVRK
jgi:hypothetical protein